MRKNIRDVKKLIKESRLPISIEQGSKHKMLVLYGKTIAVFNGHNNSDVVNIGNIIRSLK